MTQEIATEAIVHYDEHGDGVVLVAKGDVIPDHVRRFLADGPASAPAVPVNPDAALVPEPELLDAMSVAELKAVAADEGIDLAGAKRKADIVALITAARSGEEAMKSPDDAHNKARTGASNKGVKGPVDADETPGPDDTSSVATGDTKE
jgi:hypothetical protein